ncbi:hypothetical protein OPS25_00765 [Alteromonas ponticola]|uniref:Lipoprotein n=1 Tax=Alteromonas aquimaris TaxID=2998417 RepID=A0ABT3P2Q3_9ALTE|nr:hypothetical protein [Alteromonas aquimaris]MCW8107033.1 hypothetical protein [Alteromonas aquimaris]
MFKEVVLKVFLVLLVSQLLSGCITSHFAHCSARETLLSCSEDTVEQATNTLQQFANSKCDKGVAVLTEHDIDLRTRDSQMYVNNSWVKFNGGYYYRVNAEYSCDEINPKNVIGTPY